jgi:type II secretory pathway component PulF
MWTLYLINIAIFICFLFLAWKKPGIATILLIPTAIGIFLSGLIYFDGEIVDTGFVIFLLPIILVPITLCIIHWGPSSGKLETPWYKNITNVILTLFKYLLFLAFFCLLFQFFGPILFIVFVIGIIEFNKAQKVGLVVDIISVVGASMRQSLPLPTALAAAAYGHKKKAARIFNNIAYWLTQGYPLSESLRRGYPKCPSNILASILAAEKMDQLPKAIESLQANLAEKTSRKTTSNSEHIVYPLVVLTAVFSIMMGLSVFIVPTFAEVLWDMSDGQAYLPTSTQSLLNFSNWLMGRDGMNALIISLVVLCVIFITLYIRSHRRSPENPRILSRLGDKIKWITPVLHWFEKTFGNLHLVQILRAGLHAGYPVNTILRNASGLDVNVCYQDRIRQWLKRIESGEDISKSARTCGLDKPLAWAFDDTINKGNTPKILEGLEEVYRCQYNYRKNVLIAASEPLMILGLGLIVGFVVYAMFMGAFSILFVTLQYTIPQ